MRRITCAFISIILLLCALTSAGAADIDECLTLTVVDAQGKPIVDALVTNDRMNPPELLPGKKRNPESYTFTDTRGQIILQGYDYPHDQLLLGIQDQYFCIDVSEGGNKNYTLPLRPNPTPDPDTTNSYSNRRNTDVFVVDTDGNPVSDLVVQGVLPSDGTVIIPAKKTDSSGAYACGVLQSIDPTPGTGGGYAQYEMTLTNPYAQPAAIVRKSKLKMGVFLRSTNYEGKLLVTYVWEDEKPADSLANDQNKTILYIRDKAKKPLQGIDVRVYDQTGGSDKRIMQGYTDYGGKFIIQGDVRALLKVSCSSLDGTSRKYMVDTRNGGDLSFDLTW